jgi:hypothetical protein
MKQIRLRTDKGVPFVMVNAVVRGQWAYHRSITERVLWTVTHVPSGYSLGSWWSLKWVKRLMVSLADVPAFVVPKDTKRSKRYRVVVADLRKRIRDLEPTA